MSLTVKAFLAKNGQWDAEIRRFQVPADVSSSYDYLYKKLCEIFPSLKRGNFSLFWKDPDGDVVVFSTDEELMEALGFVSDGIFKVYITTKDGQGNIQDDDNQVHPGVLCDGCDDSIRGPRYKCLVCPDYDLCKTCEGKGMHVQHDMMKITTPDGLPGFPGFPGFPFGPHGGPPCGPHGPQGPHGPFMPPPHFRRWMEKFMKRWHKRNDPDSNTGEEKEKGEKAEKMEESGEQGESSGEECLRNVGEFVANMLNTFGIDVDVDVEKSDKAPEADSQNSQKEGEEQERKGQGRGGRGRCGGRGGYGCPRGRGRQGPGFGPWGMWDWGMGGECPPWMIGKCEKKGQNKGDTEKETHNEPQPSTTKEKEAPKSPERAPSPVPMDEQHTEQPPQKTPTGKENGWTVLTLNEAPKSQSESAAPAPQPNSEVPQPTQSTHNQAPIYPPADPGIAEALQQMMAMGFNNDGGWLTRLLEAKNGDIVQVLDAIKPQRQREDGTLA